MPKLPGKLTKASKNSNKVAKKKDASHTEKVKSYIQEDEALAASDLSEEDKKLYKLIRAKVTTDNYSGKGKDVNASGKRSIEKKILKNVSKKKKLAGKKKK